MQKRITKVVSVEQVPSLLVNKERLKDPNDMAKTFNNFLITITEKLNTQS
jgi:hypothetical protein